MSAIMEVFVKLISVVDTHEMRIKVENVSENANSLQAFLGMMYDRSRMLCRTPSFSSECKLSHALIYH